MAVLLHQRGRLVLHASGVEVRGGVAAFLGKSGQGKSTIAAALYHRGHPIVSDDVIALDDSVKEGQPMITPGYPRIKLWPDTLHALGKSAEALSKVHPLEEKRSQAASEGFTANARPLRRLYILEDGATPRISPLNPQEAFIELIRHTSRIELIPFAKAPTHLRQCAELVSRIPVCRLTVPRSFDFLPAVIEQIEGDLSME